MPTMGLRFDIRSLDLPPRVLNACIWVVVTKLSALNALLGRVCSCQRMSHFRLAATPAGRRQTDGDQNKQTSGHRDIPLNRFLRCFRIDVRHWNRNHLRDDWRNANDAILWQNVYDPHCTQSLTKRPLQPDQTELCCIQAVPVTMIALCF